MRPIEFDPALYNTPIPQTRWELYGNVIKDVAGMFLPIPATTALLISITEACHGENEMALTTLKIYGYLVSCASGATLFSALFLWKAEVIHKSCTYFGEIEGIFVNTLIAPFAVPYAIYKIFNAADPASRNETGSLLEVTT
jgi:hypothetical protein